MTVFSRQFTAPGVVILAALLSACLTPVHSPVKIPPASQDVPYESMSASIAEGRPLDALEAYEKALAARPQSSATRILHARLLMISGELEEARAELSRVLEAEPGNADALYILSLIAGLAGHEEEQETLLRRVVEIDGAHADALASLGERALARADDGAAKGYFDRALISQPSNLVALLGRGTLLSRAKEWSSAEAYFTRAVNAQPDYPFAYLDRARARQAQGSLEAALQDYSRSIVLDPTFPWSYIDRGKLFLRQARRPEAIADFSVAIALDPGQFEGYALRASALSDGGDADRAIADWERVIVLKPGYGYAYAPLAALEWTKGRWAKARVALLHAYEFQEDEHALALCAALCAIREGKGKDAGRILDSLLMSVPGDSWYRDVARFLLDRNAESHLLARIGSERNAVVKSRLLFYVAVVYLTEGMDRAGIIFLRQIDGRGSPDAIETQLARIELARLALASSIENQ